MNPDIDIIFARYEHGDGFYNAFDGKGSTLAHAFLPGQAEGAGDVHFDEDENWTVSKTENPKGSVNMLAIAVHEFGHAIGLKHSRIPDSVMSAYYRKQDVKLHKSDIENIQRLYGK
ncbi:hypothetical protein KUTeg_005307 [Tegillarca granosa]|uniref:Peptidase metallopeptidase domain-containing protein n=1 Tax=Tegillarca granosa TaxID=220873 RepID=A0ABQ9FJD3_TEGGR|nr:hypothetical protein KUTeg_005307 [Tegillarca granosa]